MSWADRSYTMVTEFSLGSDAAFAADRSAVVLATPAGRIDIVDEDGTTTLSVDGPVESVAADGYVFTLADETVTALTTSGIELWSTTVETALAIAVAGTGGVLACVTDDGRVVGLDTETGTELYAVERPHADVSDIAAVTGGYGRIVVAAWSFLTAIDDTGDVLFDRNLDGAIAQVAVLSDAVVVKLKDGRLTRLSLPDAEQTWTQSTEAHDVSALNDGVLTVDDGGLNHVDSHGTVEPLSLPGGDQVVASSDGSFVVTAGGGTQTVFRRGQPPAASLEATLLTESVSAGDPIRYRVKNKGAEHVEIPVTASTPADSPVQLTGTQSTVSLDPSDTTEVGVRVSEVTGEAPATVALAADGTTIATDTVKPDRDADPRAAVEAVPTAQRVTPDGVETTISVTNDATAPAEVSSGTETVTVPPGDTESVTTLASQDDEPPCSLSVSVGDRIETVPVAVDLPTGSPKVEISPGGDRSNPFVDVTVAVPFEATLIGRLTVEDGDRLSITRPVELPSDTELRLAVPLTESIIEGGLKVTVTLEGHAVSEQETLPGDAWEHPDGTGSGSDTRSDHASPAAAQSAQEGSASDTGLSTIPQTEPGTADTAIDRSEDRALHPELETDRSVPESIPQGQKFTEKVAVTNAGARPATDITLELGDQQYRVDRLEPNQLLEVERDHAVFETGPFDIAGGTVIHDGQPLQFGTQTVSVNPSPLLARVTAENGTETELTFSCTNTGDTPCRLTALGIDPKTDPDRVWQLADGPDLTPGETASLERTVNTGTPDTPFPAGVQYQRRDGETVGVWTLAAVGTERGGPFSLSIMPRSHPVVDRNTTIECTLTAGTTIRNLTVEADGAAVTPLATGERDIGRVEAGDAQRHVVDIEPSARGEAKFTLTVTGTAAGDDIDRTFTVSGPVAAADAELADTDITDEWTATEQGGTDAGDGVSHLVTPYRSPEGNRP
jgi:hypothetical protein